MKTREKKDLHKKTIADLSSLLLETRNSLNSAVLERIENKLKNTRLIFLKRKEISQILTVLKEKSIFEQMKGAKK